MRPETDPTPRILESLERELEELRNRSLYRTLKDRGLDFCSNDYLGLATDPGFVETVAERIQSAIRREGQAASTGSRLLSGHGQHWTDLEEQFADFAGAESALYFSSGYAANLGLIGAIAGSDDVVFSDAANHASLIDAIRLSRARKVIFPHLDLDALEDALRNAGGSGRRLIVVESVFSMDGDRAPLEELAALGERHGAGIIVDEAHATGVFGERGRGLTPFRFRDSGLVVATVSTCGKALAGPGAFVAASSTVREILINRARTFIFSTALPPYAAVHVAASIDAASKADPARGRLADLSAKLRKSLARIGADTGTGDTHIVPVILGSSSRALEVAAKLGDHGFHVRPIRPPTVPDGSARLRLSLTAAMSDSDVDRIVDAVADALVVSA